MKKFNLLPLLLILPFLTQAQKGYYSVGLTTEYGKSFSGFTTDRDYNFTTGIVVEKYHPLGLKLSLGINYEKNVNSWPARYFSIDDSVLKSNGPYTYRANGKSVLIPITVGYNVLGKTSPVQLSLFVGYSFNTQLYYKRIMYHTYAKNTINEYESKKSHYFSYILMGTEARYIFKNKYYAGATFSINQLHKVNEYSFLRNAFYSAGIKAGILF